MYVLSPLTIFFSSVSCLLWVLFNEGVAGVRIRTMGSGQNAGKRGWEGL